ncbi:MAG: ATP synthase F1 subunit epsilon [Prevotella sp.]|nr:ATP synthase F1 subunit epsilon [Prevotella sp.]
MLKLKIVSPERVEFQGQVSSVKVPGTMGSFEILDNHAPIISSLQTGMVEYVKDGETIQLPIMGGFVEVIRNEVSLCVEKE